jgi:hypothetical protein
MPVQTQVSGNHIACTHGNDRDAKAELADDASHLLDRVIILAGIARIRLKVQDYNWTKT